MLSQIPTENGRLVLAERPKRGPITDKTFRYETVSIPNLEDGQILVKIDYVSIDPTQRNWLNDARSYMEPVKIGAVMRAAAIGRVVSSKAKGMVEGDLVYGTFGWQEYWVGPASKVEVRERPQGGQVIDHLGLLGTSGMTAYFGMFDIGRLRDGETVVISGAAGSVGLIATQIALAHPKCKVIAIAGSPEKCESLKKMGCHEVLNYKDKDFKKKFNNVGLIDVYFDNVGGEILDLVLGRINPHARIICCGAISAYNATKPSPIYNYPTIVSMKAKMQGFIVFEYAHRYPEARAYLSDLKSRGKIVYDYHVILPDSSSSNGLDKCVNALEDVFEGRNYGKTLVRISKPDRESKL